MNVPKQYQGIAYKVTGEKGVAVNGGYGTWPLPRNGRPGKWLSVEGQIVPCRNGLHLARREDLVYWLGPRIWVVGYDTREVVEEPDKIVVRRARLLTATGWNEQTARLLEADCAAYAARKARVAGIEIDSRTTAAITVARRFTQGRATADELSAARSAAWSASAAAHAAARSAARSAVRSAAWSAWSAAARSAAWSEAAWSEAESAAAAWQTERLFHYLEVD